MGIGMGHVGVRVEMGMGAGIESTYRRSEEVA